jgi:extracellular factor (EF) 3-hydroxypalmitic acid methyl ester biosynthesis protein
MENPFKFLRDAEWQTLAANAELKRYAAEDVLLSEGQKPSGIHIVKSGTVRVCKDTAGFALTVGEHGDGAIFGEMSFIEALPAEVSLVAATPVEALFVTHAQIQAIIRDNPAFYGRFFQSLAWLLSRRLRATTGLVAAQRKGEDWLVE